MPLKKAKSVRRVASTEEEEKVGREAPAAEGFSRSQSQVGDPARLTSQGGAQYSKTSGKEGSENDRKAELRRRVETLVEKGAETEFRCGRLFFCGQSQSGKTSLLNSLLGKGSVDSESTAGVREVVIESKGPNEKNQQSWIASSRPNNEIERATARMVATSMADMRSSLAANGFEDQISVIDLFKEHSNKTAFHSIGVTSSYSSMAASSMPRAGRTSSSPLKFDEDLVLKYLDTEESATGLKLAVWDLGGSEVFHTLYHLFFARSGCYIVTFNMQALTESAFEHTKFACLNFLRFWLSSVAMHTTRPGGTRCAPIVLVGTHKDFVSSVDQHEKISELLIEELEANPAWESVEHFRESRLASGQGNLCFYPVSNKVGKDDIVIAQLKATIGRLVSEDDCVNATVPLQWMVACDALQKETKSAYSLRDLEDLCGRCGLPSKSGMTTAEEMVILAKYLTGLGVLLHNNEETALRHHVMVNPAWLFIRPATRIVCDFRQHFLPEHEQARRSQPHLWSKLKSKGILSRKLLPLLWPEFADSSQLERLMVKFGLIVPLLPAWSALMDGEEGAIAAGPSATHEEATGGREAAKEGARASAEEDYLVPSILPELQEGELLRGSEVLVTCYLVFAMPSVLEEWRRAGFATMEQLAKEGFCPSGFFARLVGKCVLWSQSTHGWGVNDMVLGAMGARLCYGSHWFVLRSMPEFQCVRLELLVPHTNMVLGRVVEQAKEVLRECMPGVDCEAAAPSDGGRRKGGYSGFHGSLVLIEAMLSADSTRSEMQVDEADKLLVMDADTLRARYDAFLPPKGQTAKFHMFLSYRWGPEDTLLAEGLFSRLSLEQLHEQPLRVFRDVFHLQAGRTYRQDFLEAMLSSAVVVPVISKWAIHHMLRMTADSPVDSVLLEWTLFVELLELGRLRDCFPVLLGHWLQAPSPTGAMVSPLFAPPGPVPASLPEVAVRSVNFAAGRALKQSGIEPSAMLSARTVRSVVSKLTDYQGIATWSLPRPSTGHGRGGLSGDGGWVDRSGGGRSSAHQEQEFKGRLLREAAAKCLLCLRRCLPEPPDPADDVDPAAPPRTLAEAARPTPAVEAVAVSDFEAQLRSLPQLGAEEPKPSDAPAVEPPESAAGSARGRERFWDDGDLQAEWDSVQRLKCELEEQVQRARAEADAVARIRAEMEERRLEMEDQLERTEQDLAHVETLRMMLQLQATKQGLGRVSDPAPVLPLRAATGSQRALASSLERGNLGASFTRTRTSPAPTSTSAMRRTESTNGVRLRALDARGEPNSNGVSLKGGKAAQGLPSLPRSKTAVGNEQ